MLSPIFTRPRAQIILDAAFPVEPEDAGKGKGDKDDDATKQLRAQQEQQEVVRQLQRTLMHLETGREGVYNPLPLVKACSALRLDYPVRTD